MGHRARLDGQAKGLTQLERVLPYLLHGGHLTPEERLVCFRSSKGMAEPVLRHAARVCLTLALGGGTAVAAGSGAGSSRQLRAHAKAAQQLAAPSDNVKLVLNGGLLTPAACLWQRITAIELRNIQLDQTSASQLQLHRLPRLHTLSLRDCKMAPARSTTGSSSSTSRQQQRSTSVRTLEWLVSAPTQWLITPTEPLAITSARSDALTHVFPYVARELVDPSQVHTVITDNASVTTHLPQLPALQQLHILPAAVAENSKVFQEEFEQLLAHPRLAWVQLADVELEPVDSFAGKPCAWERLDVIGSIDLESLGCIPLATIQSCAVHGRMSTQFVAKPAGVRAAVNSISRVHQLVFQASSGNTECFWQPAEPSFELKCWQQHSQVSAWAITLAIRHLAPGTVLVLSRLDIDPPEVQASLAAVPATVTTLCLLNPVSYITDTTDDFVGMLAHMPQFTRLVLGLDVPGWERWLCLLMKGVTRPLRLTLVCSIHELWNEDDQEEVRELVADATSGHAHIEFQHTEADLDTD